MKIVKFRKTLRFRATALGRKLNFLFFSGDSKIAVLNDSTKSRYKISSLLNSKKDLQCTFQVFCGQNKSISKDIKVEQRLTLFFKRL